MEQGPIPLGAVHAWEQKDGLCLKEKLNIRQESGWLQTDGEEGSNETIHATVTGRPLHTGC